jgi:hypothetical protein
MLKSSSLCLYSSNLGTFWLKIEQFWPFEEISIFSNGGHLGIFYELWTFVDFDRLCKLEKRGDGIKKNILLWNYWANLNQTLLRWTWTGLTDTILKGDHLRIISAKFGWDWLNSFREDFFLFHPPFFLICIIGQNRTKNRNFFKWPKLLYFKPESAQIWTV